MNLLENIKQKIKQVRTDEEVLGEEIENNSSSAVEDSEKVLEDIEEIDREFVDLLISDNADEAFNSAINIIKTERDISNFLGDLSTKISEIERALKNGNERAFVKKVNEIRSEIRELSSRREQFDIDQISAEAIFLLDNFENLEKEFEWFEKAVKTLEREERLLEQSRSDKELELERSEIRKIEETIPRLESQLSDLRDLAQKHEDSKLKSDDFEVDIDLSGIKSMNLDGREKAEVEYLVSLIEELNGVAKTNKEDPNRRGYLKMVAGASAIVMSSFFAKEATEFYPDVDMPGSERGKWSRKDKLELNGLNVAYVVKGEGSKAELVLDFQNVSEEIVNIEAAVEIPKPWKEKSEDMNFQEVSNMSDQMSKKFHLVPSKEKTLELLISEISDDTRGSIHLKVGWGTSKDNLQSETVPIDMVS